MADQTIDKAVAKEIKNPMPAQGAVDLTQTVEVTTTKDAPYHGENEKIKVAPLVAEKMKANGWAK